MTRPPDIYINPELNEFRTLHFYKASKIYERARAAKDELKEKLEAALAEPRSR